MARYDFRSHRLYVDQRLTTNAAITLDAAQTHYLIDVLRLAAGDALLVFNGRDGEWQARLGARGKKSTTLELVAQTRAQTTAGNLYYMFAPLKRARLDYMVQKAVEMGASRLVPVITRHTNAERVNTERMRANAIEAAEQCGVLNLADVAEPLPLARALAALEPERLLIFCDEDAVGDAASILAARRAEPQLPSLAVLVGPEGGFADEERKLLLARANTVRLPLGPRILRADTAAVAALALVQATLGDWR